MGLKIVILGIIILAIIVNGISGGLLVELFLPHTDTVLGQLSCKLSGVILNPMVNNVPIPVVDDFIVVSVIVGLLTLLILRDIKSGKRLALAIVLAYVIVMILWKILGYVLADIALNWYGIAGCIEDIDMGFVVIKWSWFSPLMLIGVVFAGIFVISTIFKIRRMRRGQ